MRRLFFFITTFIFLVALLPYSKVEAELPPENRLEVTVLSKENGVFEIALSTALSENYSSYYIEINYPEFLSYRDLENGGSNCNPKVTSSERGKLVLECQLPDGKFLDERATLGVLQFLVLDHGKGNLEVNRVRFGGDELQTKKLFLSSPTPDQKRNDMLAYQIAAVLMLGIILLFSGLIIIKKIHKKSKRSGKNDQLVLLGMIGIIVLSMTISYFLSVEGDFDIREEASIYVCEADCENKECGDDGCGGVCGTCSEGDSCDDYGMCRLSEEPESVKGVFIRSHIEGDLLEYGSYDVADVNLDGKIDMRDYSVIVSDIIRYQYHGEYNLRSDMNEDKKNDTWDYVIFVEMYLDGR